MRWLNKETVLVMVFLFFFDFNAFYYDVALGGCTAGFFLYWREIFLMNLFRSILR